jgi:4-hydroxy-tetrahydrodipicolinate synthase
MATHLHGVIVPIITPFHADESVNEAALRSIVDHLIARGVHGLFACGSQGEFFALSSDERRRVLEIVLEQAAGRVPVIAGTGAATTREALALGRHAQTAGADAVAVITPYFVKPSDDELRHYFYDVCAAIDLPVLAYNNPGRTGVALTPAVVAAVAAQAPQFVGIKDSSGDLSNTLAYQAQCPPGFQVFMGRDSLIYPALCMGCAGAVAASANVAPELAVGIYKAFQAGDHALARERQAALVPLRQAFSLGSFPVVIKDAMALLGLPAGPCRAPIRSLSGAPREALRQVLREMNLL